MITAHCCKEPKDRLEVTVVDSDSLCLSIYQGGTLNGQVVLKRVTVQRLAALLEAWAGEDSVLDITGSLP